MKTSNNPIYTKRLLHCCFASVHSQVRGEVFLKSHEDKKLTINSKKNYKGARYI